MDDRLNDAEDESLAEETYRLAQQAVEVRELDFVTVVGKTEPVRIFELLGLVGEITPDTLELRDLFVLQNTIHWIKSISIEEKNGQIVSRGHFKPISSRRFLNDCHEYVFHFTKSGRVEIDRLALGVPYQDKSNIARWSHTSGRDRRCRGNTWFIPYETIQSRQKERPHPATFPVGLAEWCIKLHGVSRVQTMLDPFLGIGNSAVAARNYGVKEFIGFEVDETYLAEAQRRIRAQASLPVGQAGVSPAR